MVLRQLQVVRQTTSFTVGICATGASENLPALLNLLASERFDDDKFTLRRVVVVASACPESTLERVRQFARNDNRVLLIEEVERKGKADAVNKIISNSLGSYYILFVNADALPTKGSLAELLETAEKSKSIGVVSGAVFLDPQKKSTTSLVEELMWSMHNQCSLELNHMNISNHGSDEMMVIRSSAIPALLPKGLINDGAYLGGTAKSLGYSIKFSQKARVKIDAPARVSDLVRQRQRIIFGHFQIWRLKRKYPKTVESMLLFSPEISLGIAVKTLSKRPRLLKVAPLALFIEAISFLLAVRDTATSSSQKHRIWKRYAK
jgi:cellulose synthase/poly-beta-1,6-N-acetylglucosamine synthase-like glycosyltransferase